MAKKHEVITVFTIAVSMSVAEKCPLGGVGGAIAKMLGLGL